MGASNCPVRLEVERRLREASRLSDLDGASRVATKIDMSPAGVSRRLREASDLLDACRQLAALRPVQPGDVAKARDE